MSDDGSRHWLDRPAVIWVICGIWAIWAIWAIWVMEAGASQDCAEANASTLGQHLRGTAVDASCAASFVRTMIAG